MTTGTTLHESLDLYRLPEELVDLRAVIRGLAEKEIAPFAAEVDEHSRFPVNGAGGHSLYLARRSGPSDR